MVDGIREMLDNNISFSLYMTHGGTSFGHWAGANSPGYLPTCSSYDYDAPISEAGWVTDKYFALRELLSNYLDEEEELIDIPQSIPTIQIPEIRFTESALVFDNLPQAKFSKDIASMEIFDQGFGSILYRTSLPAIKEETSLVINEVHDWAQIYINGELITRLDRRHAENSVKLTNIAKGAQLDILVDATGRINFDKEIYDWKGITESVELVTSKKTTSLKNWEVYNFPTEYEFVKNKKYTANTEAHNAPAYYKGSFTIDNPGDVFLDMQNWGKGLVWVNGKSVGRFWEIGPQQTLFLPGVWLKKGENEIIVLDSKGPKKALIRGLDKPILDVLGGEESVLHRQEGETLNLKNEKAQLTGSFKAENGWQQAILSDGFKTRFVCLEILSAHNENKEIAIAELNLIGAEGKDISRQNWKIIYADSENTATGNNTADKIFDLQPPTYWETSSNGNFPHQIVIDLGEVITIKGLRYLPRMEEGVPGAIKDYRLYLKEGEFTIDKE